jgi:hypothetical protein
VLKVHLALTFLILSAKAEMSHQEEQKMKRLGLLLFSVFAIALKPEIALQTALAQVVSDNNFYFTTYYSNNVAAIPDETLRIVNDGDTGKSLWASLYVFDDSQELSECCSCEVTPDGVLSESVRHDLTSNPLTGRLNTRGIIKVISSSVGDAAHNVPTPGLRGWATHIQSVENQNPYGPGAYSQTETMLADSTLAAPEQDMLQLLCYYEHLLGGTHGTCYCTREDSDF